jgi:hypothetical protein
MDRADRERLAARLGGPGLNLAGDAHWRDLRERTGIRVPADFQEFADAYGPGLLNGRVHMFHPSRGEPRLGDYIRDRAGEWAPVPEVHAVPLPYGVDVGNLMPFARSGIGVDVLFRIEDDDPNKWRVCAFASDVDEFVDFGCGFAPWLWRYLDGDEEIEPWIAGCGDDPASFASDLDRSA